MVKKFLIAFKILIYSVLVLFNSAGLLALLFPGTVPVRYFNIIFRTVCHRGDSIIFLHQTIHLPLCFRCSGLYFFLLIGLFSAKKLQKLLTGNLIYLFIFIGVLPMILDGFFKFSAQSGLPFISFLTGSLFGFTCGVIIMYGINNLITKEKKAEDQ